VTPEQTDLIRPLLTLLGGGAIGALVTVLLGPWIKDRWDRRHTREEQKYTHWAPLLWSARNFEQRLAKLKEIYRDPPTRWDDHTYRLNDEPRPYPSTAHDFCELLLLDSSHGPLHGWSAGVAASARRARSEDERVKGTWDRFHELTYAASSMYMVATYLAHAQRVRADLEDGRLLLPQRDRVRMLELLGEVRQALNGRTGAGIIFEHQELIGENMWTDRGAADLLEFYRWLLGSEWVRFTELFRFFIDVQYKMATEVEDTVAALGRLRGQVGKLIPELGAVQS
jgi:hypothetical protein